MRAEKNVIKVRLRLPFAASLPYWPEDRKSLENDVAEPPNRPQNVNECIAACQNHPPEICETSPLPEPISTSSSTSSACLCPDPQCAKWGAGGVPPEGVFNNGKYGWIVIYARVLQWTTYDRVKVPKRRRQRTV